jgi:hypothetical protein
MTLAMGTVGFAEGPYWVVGNRATNKCDIVTSNPVVMGDIWFQDGPYKSLADVISPARPSAPARRKIRQPIDRRLVQGVIAALEWPAHGHRGVKLHKFRLQLLVDQQQRLQRAVQVTVALGHDLVDGSVICPGNHRKSSDLHRRTNLAPQPRSCGLCGKARRDGPDGAAPRHIHPAKRR